MTILKENLSEQVYKILKEEIINQRIPSGTKITLKMLQNKFNLSTTPLREAMNLLINEGLLVHKNHIGTEVVKLEEKDIVELYYLCNILDKAALEAAYLKDFDALIMEMAITMDAQKNALLDIGSPLFLTASDEFHNLIYILADNARLYESSKRYRNQITILVNQFLDSNTEREITFKEHLSIFEALCQSNIQLALSLLDEHFINGRDKVLKGYHEHKKNQILY
ncbi:MAG: GntR family transcriptional regulator [Clostridia bacterium]|nr:GntR family transcriptional regulator [Clostridia bacterium]